MLVFHECPECGDEISVNYDSVPPEVQCSSCERKYKVDYDAVFEDGRWKDQTSLHEIKP